MPYLKPLLLLLLTLTLNANNTKEHYNYDDLNRLTAITTTLSNIPSSLSDKTLSNHSTKTRYNPPYPLGNGVVFFFSFEWVGLKL